MQKIYLAVLIIFISSILLFVFSFVYLDKENHKLYNFILTLDDKDIGIIKIDRFATEDKLIYKSTAALPSRPILAESKEKITLDKRYRLVSYLKDDSGGGAQDTVYLENTNNNISFVATSRSQFACLADMPIKEDTFIFQEDSPVTYLPILENYNFRTGRSQAFNVITNAKPLFPPMKRLLTLTSIRDEYIKMGSRRIKVECLVIKIKNHPQGMLWVTKSGRNLVGVEFPQKKLKLTRTFMPKTFKPEPLSIKDDSYREESVRFTSSKVSLAGTLTIPNRDAAQPAVLLIGGGLSSDRENNGLFTYIADTLGRIGYLVLRFDERGIGASGGDSRAVTDMDEFEDANAALDYILSRKETDPQRVAAIGHGKGAFFAAKLTTVRKDVRALILMAPLISLGGETDLNFDNLNEMSAKLNWDAQYLKLIIKSRMETMEKVKQTKNNWTSILRTRCFLKKTREEIEEKPTDIIRKVEVPVLILHGKRDELIPIKAVATLDNALEDSGNKNHKLIYYGYLGHFFGNQINDGVHKSYYGIDRGVLNAIVEWLENNLSCPTAS
jgi:uncharacterized protein